MVVRFDFGDQWCYLWSVLQEERRHGATAMVVC